MSLPKYKTPESDGCDVMACFDCDQPVKLYTPEHPKGVEADVDVNTVITIRPGCRALIPSGLKMELPIGTRFHITPRSGLALKQGVIVLNTPGKIDSDYRGNVGIIIINLGFEDFEVKHGMEICQGAVEYSNQAEWEQVENLSDTVRGEGGFGHTGTEGFKGDGIVRPM